jgi:hypothetical protein
MERPAGGISKDQRAWPPGVLAVVFQDFTPDECLDKGFNVDATLSCPLTGMLGHQPLPSPQRRTHVLD